MKIGANFFKENEPAKAELRMIKVEANGETYDVGLRDELTVQEKIDMVQDFLFLISTNVTEDNEDLTKTEVLMAIIKATTDIEFPEDKVERLMQFRALALAEVLDAVMEQLGGKVIDNLVQFIAGTLVHMTGDAEQWIKDRQDEAALVEVMRPIEEFEEFTEGEIVENGFPEITE